LKNLTEFQKGYISGIIDGEGCMTLVPKGRYMPVIDVTSTNEYMIDWMCKVTGGAKIPNHTKNKPAWHCRFTGAESVSEVLLIGAFLIKKQQWELLTEACSMLLLGPYDKSRMMQIYAKLRELNKR